MSSRSIIPEPNHAAGESLNGFVIDAVTEIPDIKALAYEATHVRTGAQVLHVHCNDEENLFSVGFRTPPSDSTGVAHILEHSVLAGSQKYPVKDAFNELGKRTLNTFLNAMTWPDRTVYPVCSAVRADYFNLASVYSDLVFNPLLKRQTFEREGHHLETDGDKLKISGVVYNEMKGVYSDPQQTVGRALGRLLSPDTPYGVDSGGDPEVIPDLTYEQFVEFHKRFYAPSNARFLLYGDISLNDNLSFIDGVLTPFDKTEVDSAIPNQGSWETPRSSEVTFPVGPEDSLEGQSFAVVAWLSGESKDLDDAMLMEVVTDALYGSAAGPLRKALIDSGLGKDVYPRSAYDTDLRQGMIHFGLRGTDPEKAEAVEALILETLEKVAKEGLDPELIEASLHQVAFHTREIVPPFPIMVLMRANPPWYYGGDPKDGLRFGEAIDRVRARYKEDPEVFNRIIREKLLANPHRLRLLARPSNTLVEEWESDFEARMAARKDTMSEDDIKAIEANVDKLNAEQQTPDTSESLGKLPQLSVEDIPRKVRTIPTEAREEGGVEIFEHPVFSNGIGYMGLDFDVRGLSPDEVVLLPFLGRATLGMGAAGLDYEAMARRISRHTGGLSAHPSTGRHLETGALFERLCVDGKVLGANTDKLISVLRDVLTASDTGDAKRLGDLVREAATRSASMLIPRGHMFAYRRAAASLDTPLWRQEQWEGVTQVKHLGALAEGDEAAMVALGQKIAALQKRLFVRSRVSVRLSGDADIIETLRPQVTALLASLPEGEPASAVDPGAPDVSADGGVVIAGQVNYVGQVLKLVDLRHEAAPALEMLASILSSEVLYAKLRVQGGAYGGFAFYSGDAGIMPLLSYRDPNLSETFDVYAGLLEHIKALGITDETVDASRIGAIGSNSRILSPAGMLQTARRRHLLGITDAHRTAFREGLLTVTAKDILEKALPLVAEALKTAPRAALGSKERLDAANETLGGSMDIVSV